MLTLSKEIINYFSTGHGRGDNAIIDAIKATTDNLPVGIDQISKLIIQLWYPKKSMIIANISQLGEF